MTPLRQNLDRAKAGYGEIRYRGDLARDVLGAMATGTLVTNLWRRRALAIAAAVALSATTFYAGSYVGRAQSSRQEVAQSTPTEKSPASALEIKPEVTRPELATTSDNESFTLVPSLASVDDTQNSSSDAFASAEQSSMDFSMSVPASPMLFSLATLADQETQSESTIGTQTNETESRS